MSTSGRGDGAATRDHQHDITITYAGAESLVESAAFGQLLTTFSSQLPLRNLHWKPSQWTQTAAGGNVTSPGNAAATAGSSATSAAPIRTIQTLGVRLEPLSDTLMRIKLKPETRHLVQRSLLERPFCHLYFVIGDDSEAYRSHIRNDIRTWLATIQSTPTLSAASVTARAFSGVEPAIAVNGQAASRPQTPPTRPDTPTRKGTDESASSSTKEKAQPPSPEYLIVVITPPDGSALAPPTPGTGSGRNSPLPPNGSTSSLASTEGDKPVKSGLQRFYSSSNTSTTSSSKGGVVDKVRADFNTSRKERVLHLTRLPNLSAGAEATSGRGTDPTIFADLLTRIKESVTVTFDAVVAMQGDAVRKELAKRDVPGWNYNKWMAGMECMASTFQSTGLYPDALAQYEEVESVFLQCLLDGKLPYFTCIGGTSPGDDAAPLLDVDKKDYRDLILRNEISLFDCRTYLFAKRAHLLGKMGRISQVMSETPLFLSSVVVMLQGETLAKHFIESWTYSSAIDVVEQCQAWLIERGDVRAPGIEEGNITPGAFRRMADRIADSQLSASFHAAKAELLDLARRQLDKIGIDVGHLPNATPFSLSLSIPPPTRGKNRDLPALPGETPKPVKSDSSTIARREIREALDNREVFDLRYVELTERVLSGWISSGRRRNALRLRGVLGSLEFFRERYVPAYAALTSMMEPYVDGQWREIEATLLARQLVCHEKLAKPHDPAYIDMMVALLRTHTTWASAGSTPASIDPGQAWLDVARLTSTLRKESKELQDEVAVRQFGSFSTLLKTQTAYIVPDRADDGLVLDVAVKSDIHLDVEVDDVRACLTGGAGRGDLWFTSGAITLQPGTNRIRLRCAIVGIPGRYIADVSQIRLGKVILQYDHKRNEALASPPTFVTIPEDGDALDATLEWAPHVFLDRSRTGVLTVASGRNEIDRLTVRVKLSSSGTALRGMEETVFEPPAKSSSEMSAEADTVTLRRLSAHTNSILLIPFHEVSGLADGILQVTIEMDYWTASGGASSSKALRRNVDLSLGLPLGVNVQDFFRHDRLLSKFLISAGAAGPLRLANVDLWSDAAVPEQASYTIESPRLERRCIITAVEPASFVFCIRKNAAAQRGLAIAGLRLTLVYRTAQEEAVEYLLRAAEKVGEEQAISTSVKRCLVRALSRIALADVDQEAYSNTAQLRFKPMDRTAWTQLCRGWCGVATNDDVRRMLAVVSQVYRAAEALAASDAKSDRGRHQHEDAAFEIAEMQAGRRPWRKLSLPVDVPTMTMVNAVTIKLHGSGTDDDDVAAADVRVGVPVEALIEVETSFAWHGQEQSSDDDDDEREEQLHVPQQPSPPPRPPSAPPQQDDDEDFEDAMSVVSSGAATPKAREAALAPEPSTSPPATNEISGAPNGQVIFASVDVNCDFVTWLLVGTKRTVISVPVPVAPSKASRDGPPTHKSSVALTLVPLQSGRLPLPTVTVAPLSEPIAQDTSASNAHQRSAAVGVAAQPQQRVDVFAQSAVSSDTFITNEAQHVLVHPRHTVPPRETFWVATAS